MELRNIMTDNGFKPIAAGAFVGAHAFSYTLAKGRQTVTIWKKLLYLHKKLLKKLNLAL